MDNQAHYNRAYSRLAPSQWETSLQSNAVSHWLSANLESAPLQCNVPHTCMRYHYYWIWKSMFLHYHKINSWAVYHYWFENNHWFNGLFCKCGLPRCRQHFRHHTTHINRARARSTFIISTQYDVAARFLANGSTAFKWKLCCHWLKGLL